MRPGGRDERGRAAWVREWLLLTAATAAFQTVLDAALIQRKRGFFTGGFLSVDDATSPVLAAGFLIASVLSDAAVTGALVAAGLWMFRRMRSPARPIAIGIIVLVPFTVSNFVSYQIASYFGEGFDVGLLFDLAGRRPSEILAVASAHLLAPSVVLALGFALVVGGVVWVWRRSRHTLRQDTLVAPGWRGVVLPAACLVLGLATTVVGRTRSDVLDNGLRRKPSGDLLALLTSGLSDVDRDGYGVLDRPADFAPLDGHLFPYALDRPGNGLDENGVGGDLPDWTPEYREPASTAPSLDRSRPVVLAVLESFRADLVGAARGGRQVTPVINGLAARGISLERAYSHNGYTTQSRFHLFTGSLPGLRGRTSLVDDFLASGFEVAYFSAQDESFGDAGQDVGFRRASVAYDARQDRNSRYSFFATPGSLAVPCTVLLDRVVAFLRARDAQKPLFLYVNFHDTHFPYHHQWIEPLVDDTRVAQKDIAPARSAALQAMYANTAANVDRALGEVLTAVERTTGRTPAVVVTADHGESLYEEAFLGHGYALNEVQTRIPLVAAGLPLVVGQPFGQVDLRDAIRRALSGPRPDARPRVEAVGTARVFQYLGRIDRPAQIAFVDGAGRLAYDFRANRVTENSGAAHRPGDLTGKNRQRYLELVRFWERMMLARAGERS